MPAQRLKEFLDDNQVKYITIMHSPAHTSQEIAASAHIPGREMAKTVMVMIDNQIAMAVLPAPSFVDIAKLAAALGVQEAGLCSEDEFKDAFPGCDVGAMPPLGNLFGMDVFVDEALTRDDEIAFNAGSFHELIRMAYADFERLVKPKVCAFAID